MSCDFIPNLAGQQAVQRSALVEAVNPLRTALELLQTLSDSGQRGERELELLATLGPVCWRPSARY